MTTTHILFAAATALVFLGLWLILPQPGEGGLRRRGAGAVLVTVGFGLFAAEASPLGHWAADAVFAILAFVTILAAVGAVTMRSPVYCAIWFALSLLGTAALFLLQGAQFLGVATIVVYAGAILVTFFFVLMLAQPEGHAPYDRLSWDAPWSAATGALIIGILTTTVTGVLRNDEPGQRPMPAATVTEEARQAEILASDHMARLGGELFSRHLIAVEVAGTLLLIALVGTVAIVAQTKMIRREGDGAHG